MPDDPVRRNWFLFVMVGHAHPILWRVIGGLFTIILLILAALVWRLNQGPIDVSFVTPLIEEQMADAPVRLRISETALEWQGSDRPLTMALSDVRLIDPVNGEPVVTLPRVLVSLSGPALLTGQIVPTRMSFDGVDLRLQVNADGALDLGLADPPEAIDRSLGIPPVPASPPPADEVEPEIDSVTSLLQILAGAEADRHAGMEGLTQIDVIDASLEVFDAGTGQEWLVEGVNASVQRAGNALTAEATAVIELTSDIRPVNVRVTGRVDPRDRTGSVRAYVDRLPLAALAGRHPALQPLEAIDIPLSLRAEADFAGASLPDWLHLEAELGAGDLILPTLYSEPLTIARAGVSLDLDLLLRQATIEQLEIDLGGPRILAEATATEAGDLIDAVAEVRVVDLPIDLLDRYWPDQIPRGGRRWITANINRGTVTEALAELHLQMPLDGEEVSDPLLRTLSGHINFEGATLTPLGPPRDDATIETWFPPITGINGRATFTQDAFLVETQGGQLAGVAVPESSIIIDGFDADFERIDIDVVVSGGVPEILTVLDREPLGFVDSLGISPSETSGQAAGRLRFAFPLTRSLTFDDVRLAAAANLEDGALPSLIDRVALTDLNGTLSLDGGGLQMTGTGRANGVAAEFTWREPFSGGGGSIIEASATLDDEERDALRVIPDIGELRGSVDAQMIYRSADQTIEISADLQEAEAALPELNWRKPAGLDGMIDLTLWLEDGVVRRIDPLRLSSDVLDTYGRITLTEDGHDIAKLELDLLRFAGTDVRLVGELRGDTLDVTITGESIDLVTLFNDPLGRRVEDWSLEDRADRLAIQVDTPTADNSVTVSDDPGGPSIDANVFVHRVRALTDTFVTGVSGNLSIREGEVTTVDIHAALEVGGAPFQVLQTQAGDVTRIQVSADDAGGFIEGLGITSTLREGSLLLNGEMIGPEATMVGNLVISDLLMVDAPIMARVLAAVSLVGLVDAANTEGLRFRQVEADFTHDDGLIQVSDGLASGASLGISADGAIDLDNDLIDLAGTIVPVAGVNRVIGAIPVLGTLLTGGNDGGLIAFTYSMRGDLDEPAISVNPLSALAPGFLRRLFFERADPGQAISEHRDMSFEETTGAN